MAQRITQDENVVDSWEDDVPSDGEAADPAPQFNVKAESKSVEDGGSSEWRNVVVDSPYSAAFMHDSPQTMSQSLDGRRPEKQTAVAGRMIAGALGIRAPKKSDEQRAYDRAMKEKEIKKRNEERQAQFKAKEEAEKAKAAVWEE